MTDQEKAECIRLISEAKDRFITQFIPSYSSNTSTAFNGTAREYTSFMHNAIQHLQSSAPDIYPYNTIVTLIGSLNALMDSESDDIILPSLTTILLSTSVSNVIGDVDITSYHPV